VVLEKGLLPWAIVRGGTVYITTGILEELRPAIGDMSLKSLAELLGWSYNPRYVLRKGEGKVTSKSVIEIAVDDLLDFLSLSGEGEGAEQA